MTMFAMKHDNCPTCRCTAPVREGESVHLSGGLKGRLIKHAASLLTERMSEFDDDYPKRFPKKVLREIERHNERLRLMAIDLRLIADAL
jgi:hypothetical protein